MILFSRYLKHWVYHGNSKTWKRDFCNMTKLGDGVCDGANNLWGCEYDHGDCCLPNAFPAILHWTSYLSCHLHYDQRISCVDRHYDCRPSGSPNIFWQPYCLFDYSLVGDGVCDDDIETEKRCLWDMGDCCLATIDTSRCTECRCWWLNSTQPTSMEQSVFQDQQEPMDFYSYYWNRYCSRLKIVFTFHSPFGFLRCTVQPKLTYSIVL